eukprot:CAMPEP_0174743590 /NCGR_PEP_ID=MMETSP1094-20130205/82027_1 /TAXON_ID=156173 /ORGANISM="Chrysochromulina brevifilum, Strain UTEX LB 985" /LENGTH=47 /DNA_ID= /DNA_START= /DNA_END= /DNA_ORIENTATION=
MNSTKGLVSLEPLDRTYWNCGRISTCDLKPASDLDAHQSWNPTEAAG